MSDAPIAELTLDSLRATLQGAGYRVEAVADPVATIPYLRLARSEVAQDVGGDNRRAGVHWLSRGCAVSLQFGDQIVVDASGTTRLTIRSSLRVNGEDERAAGVMCWQIRKSFYRRVGSERLEFTIEADVILGSGIALADMLAHGRDVYRHLRLLITDARNTLRDLHVTDGSPNGPASPVVLIEAKFLGDLAIGRSGLVASSGVRSIRLSLADDRRRLRLAEGWHLARSGARRPHHGPAGESLAFPSVTGGRYDGIASLPK
jgi:hypothetical protein